MAMKKRHSIRDSDIRKLLETLKPKFGNSVEVLFEGKAEKAELENGKTVLLSDEKPVFIEKNGEYIPIVLHANKIRLKRITVDMGAVSPISDGADIMAPGIVKADKDIEKGDIVGIEDEKNQKIFAIGKALEGGASLNKKRGKVVKNLHHVGDKFWDLLKNL